MARCKSPVECAFCTVVLCSCLVATAPADSIGFTAAEGYVAQYLAGQPGTGSVWECTTNNSPSIFTVYQATNPTEPHDDYLKVNLSVEPGSGDATTVDYATREMTPVTGQFAAGFSVYYSSDAEDVGDETCIALGQEKDSGWGVYLGMNKLAAGSMAYHNGSEWVTIATGLADLQWYDVEIVGDVAAGACEVAIYREDQRVAGDPASGRVADPMTVSFRDAPTSLAYVMMTNDGSTQDIGAFSHRYDDLALTPEPATLCLLAMGGIALLRRKRAA